MGLLVRARGGLITEFGAVGSAMVRVCWTFSSVWSCFVIEQSSALLIPMRDTESFQCWSSLSRDVPLLHGPPYRKVELRPDFISTSRGERRCGDCRSVVDRAL